MLVCVHSFILSGEKKLDVIYNVMIPKEFCWECCDPKSEFKVAGVGKILLCVWRSVSMAEHGT